VVRVVVADGQLLVRAGLRTVIDATDDIRVVGEAGDGIAALEMVERLRPDVLLMDLRAHGLDAVDAARLLQGTHLIVLTSSEHDEYLVAALREGASAFLLKNAAPQEVVGALRVVVRGDSVFAPARLRRLLARVVEAFPARRPEEPPWFRALSESDRDLVVQVARGRTDHEIAGELGVDDEVAATRVHDLLHRTGMRDRTQALIRVYETGVLTPSAD
jgi:DNA-binding NarL/FixJ family response regulator